MKSLLLLELNEANRHILEKASLTGNYPYISKVLTLRQTITTTLDTYESGFLEPWAQWVSIHTGRPSSDHGIKHLGDVANLRYPQLWELLGERNITTGIWGVMNGVRRGAPNCLFFLADPWTAAEKAYPESIDHFAELARYISRNYLNLSLAPFLGAAGNYLKGLLQSLSLPDLLQSMSILGEGLARFGTAKLVPGAFFEFTSACAFLKVNELYNPRFSLLFLNLLAHAQHTYWIEKNDLSPQLKYACKVIDMILQRILNGNSRVLLIASGLSQSNSIEEELVLYRQKDHADFLRIIGIKATKIEPLMTSDALIYFADNEDCQQAAEMLSNAKVGNQNVFYVEIDPCDSCKLFYRLEFLQRLDKDTLLEMADKKLKFFDCFQEIVTRTGKHDQEGFVYQSQPLLPEKILNYEIADYILRFFEVESEVRIE